MQTCSNSRAGAAKLATPLMILCFLSMGGFLYWLSTRSGPEGDATSDADGVALNEVDLQDFILGTQAYMGQEITLRGTPMHAVIGPRLFWTTLGSDQDLYMLFISESALADSVDVTALRRVDITGRVMVLSDSVINVWQEAGVFANEGERFQAEFATDKGDYFEILRFDMEGGVSSGEPDESDEDDPSESGDPSP